MVGSRGHVHWKVMLTALAVSIVACCACRSALGSQDEIRVGAVVQSQQVYAGEPLQLQVYVNGSVNAQEPDLSGIADATVRSLGGSERHSSSTTIVNGRVEQQEFSGYVFSYALTFATPGPKVIPSLAVVVDGTTYRTQPLQIQVISPESTDNVQLRIAVDRTKPYIGQPIRLTVTLYLRATVQSLDFAFPGIDKDFEIATINALQSSSPRVRMIDLLGGAEPYESGHGELNGVQYDTVTLHKVLIPKRAGAVTIGPGVVSCEVIAGRGRSFPFSGNETKRVGAQSNAISLDVQELPATGRPSNFTGHIGKFSISSSADPTNVSVGDPIDFQVMLRSDGPVVTPPNIDLRQQKGFADHFRIGSDWAGAKRQGSGFVYDFTIRPLHDDVEQIPPVELTYFDADSGEYVTAQSAAIDLNVHRTRVVTADDSIGQDNVGVVGGGAATIEDLTGGIEHNADRSAALRDDRFDFVAAISSPGVVAGLAAGPVVYFAALGMMVLKRRRERAGAGARKRHALSVAKRQLVAIGTAGGDGVVEQNGLGAVRGAVLGYFEARMERKEATMTTDEAATYVAGRDAALGERLRVLLARCDAGRFGGAVQKADAALVNEARELLELIDAEMRA